jgi:SAM-dependent methyltransferase
MNKDISQSSYIWKRLSPFRSSSQKTEKWILERRGKTFEFDVDAYFGKEIDISKIKSNWPFEKEIESTKSQLAFFQNENKYKLIDNCPVCNTEKEHTKGYLTICNVDYLECLNCSHVYSTKFPAEETVEKYYKNDGGDNPYYINPDEIELRLKEIYTPKVEWIIDVYRKKYNRTPESIVDIGAGSGHFLYACKKKGLRVYGAEFNKKYIAWCNEHFSIQLNQSLDSIKCDRADIISNFNVIEHSYKPQRFIEDCKRFMSDESLLVIETPKVNSFCTGIQETYPDEPRGLLIPYEHNHLFTEASLATLLFNCNLGVNSVWYFGQDMPELIMRMCYEMGVDDSKMIRRIFPTLQKSLDRFEASNLMIMAASLL